MAKTRQLNLTHRRLLRRAYRDIVNNINENKDDIVRPDSETFHVLINKVETLYKQVRLPRERVTDARALLGMANAFESAVKSQSKGISPSDFISCLIRNFGESNGEESAIKNSISWKEIGIHTSPVLMKAYGCQTMVGPVGETKNSRANIPLLTVGPINEIKPKRTYRKRKKPTDADRPEEFEDIWSEQLTDTAKTMSIMFGILKKKPGVVLENLVLNRSSFAQTVENLFALSFLVKDGRVKITVTAKGSHIVSPKNAPTAASVASRRVNYNHFVFRFDFKDWKIMRDVVPVGEELMPQRSVCIATDVEAASAADIPTATPIRKVVSRNRGQASQKISVAQKYSQGQEFYDAAIKLLPLVSVVIKPKLENSQT